MTFANSSEGSKTQKKEKVYNFRDVERDKEERAKLPGQQCFRCEEWYRGMGMDGEEAAAELQELCSRHRTCLPLNNTPPNFYDLDI